MFRRWPTILGVLLFARSVWDGVKWLLDWFGRFDLIASHLHDFGVQAMLDFIYSPPPWTVWPTMILGGALIWWDVKRKDVPAVSEAAAALAIDPYQTLRLSFYGFCAAVGISVWVMAWPVMFPARPAPPPPPAQPKPVVPVAPPPPARNTTSTAERAIYQCHRLTTDQKTDDARLVEFRKYIEAYADTNGYAFKVNAVPGGRKAEMTPATPLGQKNMGNALKMTFEVRTIGKDLFGIFSVEYQASVWGGYRLPEGSDMEKTVRKRVEDLVDVEPGACQLQ